MSRVEVTRRVRWEGSHYLPHHQGDCRRNHGHSWSAEVTVSGPIQPGGPSEGMVCDMGRIADHFKRYLEPRLDHQLMNDTMPEEFLPPTTEHVALWLCESYIAAGFPVCRVTVRETENQTATVFA